jgi:pimeloyl-ACP methyl ester carboxylesterase
VANLIEYEGLDEVMLLGHSYAGLVVTGVADRMPGRISQLVYLDTGPLPDGAALIDMFATELRQRIEQQVREEGDGWRYPMSPLKSWRT